MLIANTVERDAFRRWLEGIKGFSPGSASDVISRCKRAERLLDRELASLEPARVSQAIRERVIASGVDTERGERTAKDLERAINLYTEFSRRRTA